ncbi:hypothetical protein BRADI_4g42895v3 [Brachypodium distachyon]|uniref:Uncharacterized protein n=1 Tax=Brachypodium distachyon TaxID=15368 RepID=A0A2K2CTW8_BRADI|nr:hypothetical protein BRADI_4g42895v3 [Brachypodium distachyon]
MNVGRRDKVAPRAGSRPKPKAQRRLGLAPPPAGPSWPSPASAAASVDPFAALQHHGRPTAPSPCRLLLLHGSHGSGGGVDHGELLRDEHRASRSSSSSPSRVPLLYPPRAAVPTPSSTTCSYAMVVAAVRPTNAAAEAPAPLRPTSLVPRTCPLHLPAVRLLPPPMLRILGLTCKSTSSARWPAYSPPPSVYPLFPPTIAAEPPRPPVLPRLRPCAPELAGAVPTPSRARGQVSKHLDATVDPRVPSACPLAAPSAPATVTLRRRPEHGDGGAREEVRAREQLPLPHPRVERAAADSATPAVPVPEHCRPSFPGVAGLLPRSARDGDG